MTTLHDALLAQRSVAEQYSQYPDDSVPVEAAMAVLLLDVALAAERRRQGELEYHKAFPEAADLIARGELHPFTDLSVNIALDALRAHLCGERENTP